MTATPGGHTRFRAFFFLCDHTFYTNTKPSDIIIPKLGSIAEYEKAIEDSKKKLEDIHRRQYASMLKGDGVTVDALEKQYKATEQELDGYKIGLGEVMGANVYGKRGNQLLDDDRWNTTQDAATRAPLMGVETPTPGDKPGLHIRNQSPQFEANDMPKYVVGLNGKEDSFFGYKPDDYSEKESATNNSGNEYISEDDYKKENTKLEYHLKALEEIVKGDIYSPPKNLLYPDMDDLISEEKTYSDKLKEVSDIRDQIEKLKAQRTWSEKYELVKNNKLFNTNGFVNDQHALGETTPLGSSGNAAKNCCGAIAAQNINLLFGENSNFADVYTDFNDDSKLLGGGKMGVNPLALMQYLEDKGHKVTLESANADSLKDPGKFVYAYMWHTPQEGWGAHYMAGENNGSTIVVYNPYAQKSSNNDMQSFFVSDLAMVKFKDNVDFWTTIVRFVPFYGALPQDDGIGIIMRVD